MKLKNILKENNIGDYDEGVGEEEEGEGEGEVESN